MAIFQVVQILRHLLANASNSAFDTPLTESTSLGMAGGLMIFAFIPVAKRLIFMQGYAHPLQ